MQIVNQDVSDLLYQIFCTVFVFKLLHHLVKHLRRRSHRLSQLLELIVAHIFLIQLTVNLQSNRRQHDVIIISSDHVKRKENKGTV